MSCAFEIAERRAFEALALRLTGEGGELRGFFDEVAPIGVARAPGRLDVMGGIADYSGSLVLELPIREAACVAAQLHPEPGVRVVSLDAGVGPTFREVHVPSAELAAADYATARALFRSPPENAWAAYVAGSVVALARERGLRVPGGVRLLLGSRVPEGKGVSSSAAIEVAALYALAAAVQIELQAHEAALLCQRVENLVVGAPCGVMDPMTAACGERGRLLELLCQPASIVGHVALPEAVAFFGIDSGVRHAVSGADYADVRVAAFMGYRLLAAFEGLAAEPEVPGKVRVTDARWGGYLANVSVDELDARLGVCLPERMRGSEFLERFGGTTDPVTEVAEHALYAVRAATEHPIREHARVRRFARLLRSAPDEAVCRELGALMFASHASYSACGLGSPGTDRLVDLVRELGPSEGLYGAKITGGGSGGTVAVLARAGAARAVEAVAERYASETGHEPRLFAGSSAGASAFGTRRVQRRELGG